MKATKKQIWKFELQTTDKQEILMPMNAKILTVQTQKETPYIWALVNPIEVSECRIIEVFGTGHEIDYNQRNYLGTYQLHGGSLVFHVFENTGI